MGQPDVPHPSTQSYDSLVDAVVQYLRDLPKSMRQSGDDSPYRTVWLEYAVQMQGQHGVSFRIYQDLVWQACVDAIGKLSNSVIDSLWRDSQYFWTWIEDAEPSISEMRDAVIDELERRVGGRACDVDLS